MDLSAFFTIFVAIFLSSIAVGPIFITISSIGLTYGLKNSAFSVIGVILGVAFYLVLGALITKQIVSMIPDNILLVISFFASIFIAYIAYGFWTKDINKMQTQNFFKPGIKTIFKMLVISLSSPVALSGYIITFLTFGEKFKYHFVSSFVGGLFGSIVAYMSVAIVSGMIGNCIKKIDEKKYLKVLKILNKVAGFLLGFFASVLIINFFKTIIFMFIK